MDRFVCPPWYNCSCPLGMPVSRNTMLNHRRIANENRRQIGRGKFAWGPRVPPGQSIMYDFTILENLEEHDTDCEDHETGRTGGQVMMTPNQNSEEFRNISTAMHAQPSSDIYGSHVHDHTPGESHDDTFHLDPPPQTDTYTEGGMNNGYVQQHPVVDSSLSVATGGERVNGDSARSGEGEDPMADAPELMDAATTIAGLRDWLVSNKAVVDLYVKHSLELSVMDDILALLGAPCKSWKTVLSFLNRASGMGKAVRRFPICPGHFCYAAMTEDPTQTMICSVCSNASPSSMPSSSEERSTYIPLLPRIADMVRDPVRCKQLYQYRHDRDVREDMISDVYDCAVYQRLTETFSAEDLKWDIFVAISADGFQPYRNKRHDIWSIIGILYNLPPTMRYSTRNVLPLMYIPGPKEPKDLESFFVPLVREACESLANGGEDMVFYDGVRRKVRLHLLWLQGDTPAISKAAGLCGHKAKFPCRSCLLEGVYIPSARGYYYPSRVESDSNSRDICAVYEPENLKMRSTESVAAAFLRLENCTSVAQRNSIATETGIKRRSILLSLPNFRAFKSFPHDSMHLFYNVQREILSLITGDLGDCFSIDGVSVEKIDNEIQDAGHTISGQIIQRKPQGLAKWTSWKAIEHRTFTLYLCLIVFDGYLPPLYLHGLFIFVELLDIACRPEVSGYDVLRLGELAVQFLQHFERHYYKYQKSRIPFCKSQFHMLLHLEETIRECGPLLCTSQYVMERSVGFDVDKLNAKTLAAESLSRDSLFRESYRAFFKVPFHAPENESFSNLQTENDAFCLLGPKIIVEMSSHSPSSGFKRQMEGYFRRKFPSLEPHQAKIIVSQIDRYTSYSRIQIKVGSDTQTVRAIKSGVIGSNITEHSRLSCFFAAEMDVESTSADVYYGLLRNIIEFDLSESTCDLGESFKDWRRSYKLIAADWASGIRRGRQNQLYTSCRIENAFSTTTIEDSLVLQRLIAVMEHSVPTERPWNRVKNQR